MVSPDYAAIEERLSEKGISRRRLAIEVGIPENSLAASFLRRSKLQVHQLASICEHLGMNPFTTVKTREDALELMAYYGYPLGTENDRHDDFWNKNEKKKYQAIIRGLDHLTPIGLEKVADFLEILENSSIYSLPDEIQISSRTVDLSKGEKPSRSVREHMEHIIEQFNEFQPSNEEDPHG